MSYLKSNLILLTLFVLVFEAKTIREIPMELELKLSNLLKPLRGISLHIQAPEDVISRFFRFFINQSECPIKVFSKMTTEQGLCENNFVIVSNTSELNVVLETYSSREGTQFYIMQNEFNPNLVVDAARAMWNLWAIFKNYFVTSDRVYLYNPFAVVESGHYGALQEVKDEMDFYKVFQNINGYPLRTYIFQAVSSRVIYDETSGNIKAAEGADADIANSIAKAMNCKLILQEPDNTFFGHRMDNGSFDGAIGRALRYETDLTLTGFFVKDYLTRNIEFSVTVYMDELCCYVRKAKRIPQSILPLFSVKVDMWLGFFGAAFLWAFIWSFIRKCNLWIIKNETNRPIPSRITKGYQYLRILIDTWVIWVRVNINRYPPFSSEKIFVISLCLVSVIFGAIFESSLATVYINPLYYNDINTLQELDESQLEILIKHPAMKDDLFYGSSSEMFKRLDKKLMFVSESDARVIEVMSRKGGYASVTRSSVLYIGDISYILTKKIHMIPECPKNYHIAYPMLKNSPYRERVNDILLRLLNAGLINYWIEIMYHKARISILRSTEVLKYAEGYTWKELTIGDLQLAFYIVIMGNILATVALFTEIVTAKWLNWQNRCNTHQ